MKKKDYKQQEEQRELSPREQIRMEKYLATCADFEARGYKKTDLTVGIVFANVVATLSMIPIFGLGAAAFLLANPEYEFSFDAVGPLVFIVVFFALIVVHELIHDVTWAIFAPRHWKDVELGFMKQYLTPYCTCLAPLHKAHYVIGGLAPLVVLGLIPLVIGVAAGWIGWALMGMIMTVSAMGDVIIVTKLLRFKSAAADVVYLDHPTQAGLTVFELIEE